MQEENISPEVSIELTSIIKDLTEVTSGVLEVNEKILSLQKEFSQTQRDQIKYSNYLYDLINTIRIVIKIIIFTVGITFIRVFFSQLISNFFLRINENFANLSEAWQIAIVMIILSIPMAVTAQLITIYLMHKAKLLLKN